MEEEEIMSFGTFLLHRSSTSFFALAFAVTAPAYAQSAEGENGEESGGLSEIIITAQKKAENLQNVPLAVSAFGSEFLEQARIEGVGEIAPMTPNFQFNQFSVGRVDLFVRGIGSDLASIGSDNSVGAFVDDVYIARGSGVAGATYDLERIEVIRGPAGALYGKNTIGGAINFVTAKPSMTPEASVRADFGNFGLVGGSGFVTGPLSDKLAGRIAISASGRDGYYYNTLTAFIH